MEMEQIKNNKLQKILQFSIPCIIAMLLQTAITVTDGFFTGNYVGEHALAAINLGLPVLYFYLGAGLCVGVGGSVICGHMLGAGERRRASEVFSQTLATAAILGIAVSVCAAALFTPLMRLLKAEGSLGVYFTEYYQVMLVMYPLMVLGTVAGMFLRVDGKPQLSMMAGIVSCVSNVILDAVLIAGLGMGVRGSAIASLIAQGISTLMQLAPFLRGRAGLSFCRFRVDRKVMKDMMLNGSSEFIGEMASAISMFTFNYVLMKYVGADGVAAFTVLGYSVYGFSMICIGFGQGITPLISICRGAKEYQTALSLRDLTNQILITIGAVTAVAFFFAGRSWAGLFGCSSQVADMVADGFRIYAVTFVCMGYNVVNSMYFTSCGAAKESALISALRGIVLLLGFTLILSAMYGMMGVWLAAPCAEILTGMVSVWLILRQKRREAIA